MRCVLGIGAKNSCEWSGQGATIVGLASDKMLLGLFAVRDALKAECQKQVVEQLQQQGFLKIYILTGDNALTARASRSRLDRGENVFCRKCGRKQKADFVKKTSICSGTGILACAIQNPETHGRDGQCTIRVRLWATASTTRPRWTQPTSALP